MWPLNWESSHDEREHIIHANFNNSGCVGKEMCYINLSQKYLDNVRDNMTELCKDELDLIVMWQLLPDINIEEVTTGWRMFPKEQNKPEVLSVIME